MEGTDKTEIVAKASCPIPVRKPVVASVPEGCNELKLSIFQGNRSLGQVCKKETKMALKIKCN